MQGELTEWTTEEEDSGIGEMDLEVGLFEDHHHSLDNSYFLLVSMPMNFIRLIGWICFILMAAELEMHIEGSELHKYFTEAILIKTWSFDSWTTLIGGGFRGGRGGRSRSRERFDRDMPRDRDMARDRDMPARDRERERY